MKPFPRLSFAIVACCLLCAAVPVRSQPVAYESLARSSDLLFWGPAGDDGPYMVSRSPLDTFKGDWDIYEEASRFLLFGLHPKGHHRCYSLKSYYSEWEIIRGMLYLKAVRNAGPHNGPDPLDVPEQVAPRVEELTGVKFLAPGLAADGEPSGKACPLLPATWFSGDLFVQRERMPAGEEVNRWLALPYARLTFLRGRLTAVADVIPGRTTIRRRSYVYTRPASSPDAGPAGRIEIRLTTPGEFSGMFCETTYISYEGKLMPTEGCRFNRVDPHEFPDPDASGESTNAIKYITEGGFGPDYVIVGEGGSTKIRIGFRNGTENYTARLYKDELQTYAGVVSGWSTLRGRAPARAAGTLRTTVYDSDGRIRSQTTEPLPDVAIVEKENAEKAPKTDYLLLRDQETDAKP